jgi:prepilin-type N-terminal cleavage/methylation domain-containing protein
MRSAPHRNCPPSRARRHGFTLVEMLVATTLVVLMLLLFAQIFGDSVRIMRNQQALSQNDQKARSFDSILRADLEKATFRQVRDKGVYGLTPLRANWPVDAERQRGYFYISENDPEDPTDDVLQFTIDMRLTHRNTEISTLRGRATSINSGANPNEPDNDDGISGNDIGESPAAEVAYFLRGGNLYRRVLLLRKPTTPSSGPSEFPLQPGTGASGATPLFVSSTSPVRAQFWNEFDYSAWNRQIDNNSDNVPDSYQVMFSGLDALQNVAGATSYPLGIPQHRFGHVPTRVTASAANAGRSMEYVFYNGGADTKFIGRFTHEETSSSSFEWPGGFSNANPFYRTYGAQVDNSPTDDIIDLYDDGDRAGEDLLVSGVESFDIEIWDQGLNTNTGGWTDLGHTTAGGIFRQASSNYLNQGYGPRSTGQNWIFDTWHPAAVLNTAVPNNQPPWRGLSINPSGSGWQANTAVTTSTYVFPRIAAIGSYTLNNPAASDDDSFYYRPVLVAGSGNTGSRQPEWPREPGATVVDNEVIWQCFDNRLGLQAVKLTIRFRDPGNGLPRQVSVIHSFVE